MFTCGEMYRRRDLHRLFGGQEQGGISTPAKHAMIFLFTGESGEQHGYSDGWADGTFLYVGEGQSGDMEFTRGNKAVRDHAENGKELHLFRQHSKGNVEYLGEMRCTGYHSRTAPDTKDRLRQAIVFELTPVQRLGESGVEMSESDSAVGQRYH